MAKNMADKYGPQNDFLSGYRRVQKGGKIKCANRWYQDPTLEKWVGELVRVYMYDDMGYSGSSNGEYNAFLTVKHFSLDETICYRANKVKDEHK